MMVPPKRKAETSAPETAQPSKQQKFRKEVEQTASSERPSRTLLKEANKPRSLRSSFSNDSSSNKEVPKPKKAKKGVAIAKIKALKSFKKPSKSTKTLTNGDEGSGVVSHSPTSKVFVDLSPKKSQRQDDSDNADEESDAPQYWLMKAEPESRIEKGKDVRFSIDDLKDATKPEPWDGVRNPAARNNMRAMMKGDQAFFYHSNCKVPGIVGIMEVVQEHSVDESAFDPEHPYYDEKSNRDNPKWCVVHVEFRRKLPKMIKLKELQKYGKEGGVLLGMPLLKQSRLSVSKVSKKEWDFILSLLDEDGEVDEA